MHASGTINRLIPIWLIRLKRRIHQSVALRRRASPLTSGTGEPSVLTKMDSTVHETSAEPIQREAQNDSVLGNRPVI